MIAELSRAITNKMKLQHIQQAVHAYPNRAEVIRKMATEDKFRTLTPALKSALGMWFKVSRLLG